MVSNLNITFLKVTICKTNRGCKPVGWNSIFAADYISTKSYNLWLLMGYQKEQLSNHKVKNYNLCVFLLVSELFIYSTMLIMKACNV